MTAVLMPLALTRLMESWQLPHIKPSLDGSAVLANTCFEGSRSELECLFAGDKPILVEDDDPEII